METSIAQSIEAAGNNARFDNCAKSIIGYKAISAWILKTCTKEFADCDVKYIAEHCISDVAISEKAVHQDHLDKSERLSGDAKITSINSESTSIKEGTILYDVRFKAFAPGQNEPIGLIINIEIQNDDRPRRSITNRAEYYCARMITEQYGTVFTEGHYQDLQKVYSIWICPDPAAKRQNGIFRFPRKMETVYGNSPFKDEDFDNSEYIVIFVGKLNDPNDNQIIDLLYTIFSNDITVEEKKQRLSSVYGIEMTREIESEVLEMCNLSKGIENRGEAKGVLKTLIQLVQDGDLSLNRAAEKAGMTAEEFLKKKEEYEKNNH